MTTCSTKHFIVNVSVFNRHKKQGIQTLLSVMAGTVQEVEDSACGKMLRLMRTVSSIDGCDVAAQAKLAPLQQQEGTDNEHF